MLRDYQEQAIQNLRVSLGKGKRKPVLVAPCGSGKTVMAVEIVKSAVDKGKKVLFLAPRRELIYQAASMFKESGIHHGIIMAGECPVDWYGVQIASFDTLHARAVRTSRIQMPDADLVVVDEAHLSVAKTRQDILKHYSDKCVIGLTATPARGDGRGLGEIYDDLIVTTNVMDLTEQGYLAPVRYFAPSKPDMDGVKLNKDGDYQDKALGELVDNGELIGDIFENWKRIASDRPTVVFAVNCAHSRHLCEEFRRGGYVAEHLDGNTPLDERESILARVSGGTTQVLCNVYVATYGLDIPSLSCAVLARPTKNITLYLQTVGRILRICEGKTDAIIIDHSGAVQENGFVDEMQPWSLDSKSKIKDRKKQQQQESKQPKKLTCERCYTIFSGRRDCPTCGESMVGKSEPIPTHQADLQEIKRKEPVTLAKRANRTESWDKKQKFMGEAKFYANSKGYKPGYAAWLYKDKYGCWPNDPRVKNQEPIQTTDLLKGFITHRSIRQSFSKKNA